MIWQDIVMSIIGFGFSLALIPTILGKSKPAFLSSLLTCAGLFITTICVLTLNLWLTTAADILATIAWGIILIQTRRRSHV